MTEKAGEQPENRLFLEFDLDEGRGHFIQQGRYHDGKVVVEVSFCLAKARLDCVGRVRMQLASPATATQQNKAERCRQTRLGVGDSVIVFLSLGIPNRVSNYSYIAQ